MREFLRVQINKSPQIEREPGTQGEVLLRLNREQVERSRTYHYRWCILLLAVMAMVSLAGTVTGLLASTRREDSFRAMWGVLAGLIYAALVTPTLLKLRATISTAEFRVTDSVIEKIHSSGLVERGRWSELVCVDPVEWTLYFSDGSRIKLAIECLGARLHSFWSMFLSLERKQTSLGKLLFGYTFDDDCMTAVAALSGSESWLSRAWRESKVLPDEPIVGKVIAAALVATTVIVYGGIGGNYAWAARHERLFCVALALSTVATIGSAVYMSLWKSRALKRRARAGRYGKIPTS